MGMEHPALSSITEIDGHLELASEGAAVYVRHLEMWAEASGASLRRPGDRKGVAIGPFPFTGRSDD